MTLGNLLRLLVPTLVLVLLPLPASAASWIATDPPDDATGYIFSPAPPPCGTWTETSSDPTSDIRRVAVHHDARTVRIKVGLAEIDREDLMLEVYLRTRRVARAVDLVWPRPGVVLIGDQPDWEAVEADVDECGNAAYGAGVWPCKGLTARRDLATATVRLDVPRRCLNNPRAVQVGVDAYGAAGADRWAVEGAERAGFAPTYGPMVARG